MSQQKALDSTPDIDEGLYSRQLYTLGAEAMKRMAQATILIIGMGGLGAEISKNIILSGVKSVTIHDPQPASMRDLASQFILTEEHVRTHMSRAEASLVFLEELNPYVKVFVDNSPLTDTKIKSFSCVVITEFHPLTEHIAQVCHDNDIKFLLTTAPGLAGRIFCDFGKKFVVFDSNGEDAINVTLNSVSLDKIGDSWHVFLMSDGYHNLSDLDMVTVSDVRGIGKLAEIINSDQPHKIRVTARDTFELLLSEEEWGKIGGNVEFTYLRGGFAHQEKLPVRMKFKSYAEAKKELQFPEFIWDFEPMNILHKCFEEAQRRIIEGKDLPAPWNEEDAHEFAKAIGEEDSELVLNFARTVSGNISPTCAFIGGMAAQEVLKGVSGKYTPICQWFYWEDFRTIPRDHAEFMPNERTAAPVGSRYDGNIMVYGSAIQEAIHQATIFVIGAGALGCEFLKQYALMGFSTGPNAVLHVTDNDCIEKSNLSRQFLFRNTDVGKLKSECAAAAVSRMNSKVHIHPMKLLVAPESEEILNARFWNSLTFVCNAVDNIKARLYVDDQCIFYGKPFLESGTLGPKANSQVILPFVTESYGSSHDPEETTFPACTIHNFPYTIQHTIVWAKDTFGGFFETVPDEVNSFLNNAEKFKEDVRKEGVAGALRLANVVTCLEHIPRNWEDCLKWARDEFEHLFHNRVLFILNRFPLNHLEEDGQRFWSGTKRPPTAAVFDPSNKMHVDFIYAGAHLFADMWGVPVQPRNDSAIAESLSGYVPPPYDPVTDKEESPDVQGLFNRLQKAVEGGLPHGITLNPTLFEKDDDSNGHVDFVTAASNLRATCYEIEPADRSKTKFIAGRIIPAMITTTALIVGLVGLEAVKVVDWVFRDDITKKDVTRYTCGFVNLALPLYLPSDPIECQSSEIPGMPGPVTLWDFIDINLKDLPAPTLQGVLDYLTEKYHMDIMVLTYGAGILWQNFGDYAERAALPIVDAVKDLIHEEPVFNEGCITMVVIASPTDVDDEAVEEDYDYPSVRVWLE